MKVQTLIATGIFLATTLAGFSQPTISRFQLSGQPATVDDGQHYYASFSVSPGANVTLNVYASGTPPIFNYQWQFNHSDLPGQNSSGLNFPSVQLTNAGDYTVVVTGTSGSVTGQVTLMVDPAFTKILTGSIVTDIGHSGGGTWVDFNNDGFLDLFVFNGMDGRAYYPFLYRNNGDGNFANATSGAPVNVLAESYSACWADYDNDGNLDLFMSAINRNLLYQNNGNGTFTQITNNPAVLISSVGGWVDYDNDGFLDLFEPGYDSSGSTNARNSLYRNNGDGTFSTITNGTLLADRGSFVGGGWADYDNDANLDVFIIARSGASIPQPNRLYHNDGNGNFTKVATGSIINDFGRGSSCASGAYVDNQGFPGIAGQNENCMRDPSRRILVHEPPAGPFNWGGGWFYFFWHYARGPNTVFGEAQVTQVKDRLISPVLFADGHVGVHDFTANILANFDFPCEPTGDWYWYEPARRR